MASTNGRSSGPFVHEGRRPTRAASDCGALRRRAERLEQELLGVYAELVEAKRGSGALPSLPAAHALELRLDISASGNRVPGTTELYEQLRESVEQLAAEEARFPRGRVFCYRCEAFGCEHGRAPDPRTVFTGYSQTGEPTWREFASVLLDEKDPRIDELYKRPPRPVTLVKDARALNEIQLTVYGKHSPEYQALGQVMLGYLPLKRTRSSEQVPVALCFQAVRIAGARAPVLNILGTLPGGTPAHEVLEAQPDPRIANALRATRQRLRDLALLRVSKRRRAALVRQKSLAALQRLARNLERIFRQRARRTQHSEARHLDRRRPAATALNDAQRATTDAFYRDVEERTWVVLGPKNRVHIFNDRAFHVTSIVYQGETIRQRTTTGKWLTPRRDELTSFRHVLAQQGGRSG